MKTVRVLTKNCLEYCRIARSDAAFTVCNSERGSCSAGFTLLEMVGVLAMLAILASMMAPAFVKQLDHAAWNKELSDLGAISNAVVLQALRGKTIPDATTWSQSVATWVARPVSQVASNPRGIARLFLIDPALQLAGEGLPYVQTNTGTARPVGARVMILSSIGPPVPVTNTNANFSDIWNTPTLVKPASWAGWQGSGEDLLIQRINLEPLFYRLILVNRSGDPNAVATIDANPSEKITNRDAFYLAGTTIRLNSGASTNMTSLLTGDVSYVFENGGWQAQIVDGPPSSPSSVASAFATNLSYFLAAPVNIDNSASQIAALGAMNKLLLDFTTLTNTPTTFQRSLFSLDTVNLAFWSGWTNSTGLLYNP